MTLEQYWIILIKQWKLVVVCTLVVGLAASGGSRLITPIYEAKALVQVAIPAGDNQSVYNSLLASDQLVQTEAILATSDAVLREVTSHYPGLTVEQLSKEVTATAKLNTQLFEIDVDDASPTRAAALANNVAMTLIKQQLQQQAAPGDFLILAQPAEPVFTPVRPNVLLNTGAGLLTGLVLGMLLVVLFELLDTRVRTPEAITQLLDWRLLATIWRVGAREDLIHPKRSDANAEAYRILRANIGFSAIAKPLRFLAITSTLPREGKSVVAANLAIFMAKAGKNTILIDADLRRPKQHENFGIPVDKKGLSNAILEFSMPTATAALDPLSSPAMSAGPSSTPVASTSALDAFLHDVNIPNLYVMPSGPLPPNPAELLDSRAMQRLFNTLTSSGAEVIIFDTPPLLGLSDASILASKMDGTLIVTDITQAKKGNLKQMKTALLQAGAHVLGCIVNKQRRSRKDAIYSYYYEDHEQNSIEKQDTRKMASSTVSGASKRSGTASRFVSPAENGIKTTFVDSALPETPSQRDLLDGRKGGQHESTR